MDSGFYLRPIPLFDDAGSVVEWVGKAELICRIRNIKRTGARYSLETTGGGKRTFAVYQ